MAIGQSQVLESGGKVHVDNPRTWPSWRKWFNIILISFQAAFTPIAATILAVASISIRDEFNLRNPYTPNLPVGTFLLGNGLGPLYLSPLSEMYGRRIVYIVSFSLFTVFNIGCALSPNIVALSVFRFFSGLAGSAAATLSAASVGDLFEPHERGRAQALYGIAPLLGPVTGGVLGGFIVQGTGTWRWTMWVMAIAPGVSVVSCIAFLKESYEPVLRRWALQKHQLFDQMQEMAKPNVWEELQKSIKRPFKLLFTSPTCIIMSTYSGLAFGVYYFHIASLSLLFSSEQVSPLPYYRWRSGIEGLSYLGLGVGSLLGIILASLTLNRLYIWTKQKILDRQLIADGYSQHSARTPANPGDDRKLESQPSQDSISSILKKDTAASSQACPEARLPGLFFAQLTSPLGLLLFGLTAGPPHPWILPLVGAALFAIGLVVGHISIQTYLVDAYGRYSASALGATAVLRNLVAAVLSVVAWAAYLRLGYKWASLLLVFIFAALVVIPVVLWRWGAAMRRSVVL